MDIDKRIVHYFQKINFAERYIAICEKHSEIDKSLDNYDFDIINTFFLEHGLKMTFSKKERFFKNISKAGNFKIQFNVIPKRGYIQFVFDFKINNERLSLGWGMWESIAEELTGKAFTRKPTFCSLEELVQVLEETFEMYQDLLEEIRRSI